MQKLLLRRHSLALIFLFFAVQLNAQYDVPANYPTINQAIASAPVGSTINVAAGIYMENVIVNKRITLNGAGNSTVIDPSADGPAIKITEGGTSLTTRLIIKNLKTTGATGASEYIAAGISVEGTAAGFMTFDHVTSTSNVGYGFSLNTTSSVSDIYMQDCDISMNDAGGFTLSENVIGLTGLQVIGGHFDLNGVASKFIGDGFKIFAKNTTRSTARLVDNVVIKSATFNNNRSKGIYAERLNNAILEDLTVSLNGFLNGLDAFFPNGIDINLKYNDFQNVVVKNVHASNNLATGIYVKARNDDPYNLNPASLTNVSITGGQVSTSNIGIVFKYRIFNASVHCVDIYNNIASGLLNEIDGLPILNAELNYWGSATGPRHATNPSGTGDKVGDYIDFTPWATSADDNRCEDVVVKRGNDGCSHGYWKNAKTKAWTDAGYVRTAIFSTVFAIVNGRGAITVGTTTLDDALNLNAAGYNQVAKQGVAALLNAGQGYYPYTTTEIKAAVKSMFNTGAATLPVVTVNGKNYTGGTFTTANALANYLDMLNNLGCPLNNAGNTTSSSVEKNASLSEVGDEPVTSKLQKEFVVTGFPNPTRSAFSIQVNGLSNEKISVKVFDMTGRLVEQRSNLTVNQVLNIGNSYGAGVYYLEVTQGNNRQQLKLVKQ